MSNQNNPNENDIARRLREIERELDRKSQTKPVASQEQGQKTGSMIKLGRAGKVAALSIVVITGVWALTTVVSFVSMMLGFVIVGGVIYAGWKILYSR